MEKRKSPFSGNLLKIIAAFFMTIDHIGFMIYPDVLILRILGRISFPIFAFFIAEGCRYTKNRVRYLGTLAAMATVFQIVYFIAEESLYLSVFVTFSIGVSLIYLLDFCKKSFTTEKPSLPLRILSTSCFILALGATYFLNRFAQVDYGLWGCVTPLFASLFLGIKGKGAWLDSIPCRVALLTLPLLGLVFTVEIPYPVQWFAFLALPLLLLYNGKRGKYKMKYFFYIFYPTHLLILYAIVYFL